MIRLEKRAYSREEISEITGIPRVYQSGNANGNFISRVRERLENWHYSVETPRGGAVIITGQPETALNRLHEIMMRKLDFDVQVRPRDFACFMHFMMTVPDADCMPMDERLDYAIILMYLYAVGLDNPHMRASSVTVMVPSTYEG